MFKLGAKIEFLPCLLVKNMSAVYSADRCNSEESDNAVQDLYGIGGGRERSFSTMYFTLEVENTYFESKSCIIHCVFYTMHFTL